MLISRLLTSTSICISAFASHASALGQKATVAFNPTHSSLQLSTQGGASVPILIDGDDWPGVIRAARDLAVDFGRVNGHNLTVQLYNTSMASQKPSKNGFSAIIVGTYGKSRLIDSLVQSGKIDLGSISGQWESFHTQIANQPIAGIEKALIIAGSDKRGSIYGLYDISEQIGVSPWYFWADVPSPLHHDIYALNVNKTQGPPSVKYRGFFLNDEQPALTNWINANYPKGTYGPGYNHAFYTTVFELLLRLRANFLWPAQWDSMFDVDDDQNQFLADLYGIVMSTSHTEPMMRATKEWTVFGNGTWDWPSNNASIKPFFLEGARRARPFEGVYTMGMRGSGDTALTATNAISVLEDVVATQRDILSEVFNTTNLTSIPQAWCLYKEVQGYYEMGLTVPEDVTLLWADDNWGNLRRVPADNETSRSGGHGIYYHFDYVGDPRDYKWINTVNLAKTWEQMHLAYERMARQIWVVNVGDLKPLEVPINFFFDLAYDHNLWDTPTSVYSWLHAWATREFGTSFASATAEVMFTYSIYASRRKYELLDAATYSVINYNEADLILTEWKALGGKAQKIHDSLPENTQPAFFELVLHPVLAGYIVHEIHITTAKNNLYAAQRRTSTNALMQQVLSFFQSDAKLTALYHSQLDGKWKHMMDQTHLGYDWWQQPMRNTLPPLAYVQEVEVSLAGPLGLSVEGSNGSISGDSVWNIANSNDTLILPPLDPYAPVQSKWIDIYSRGTPEQSCTWSLSPMNSWVHISPSSGTISPSNGSLSVSDERALVSVDWDSAPDGYNIAFIIVNSTCDWGNAPQPDIHLPVNKTSVPASFSGFVESAATISIEPANYTSITNSTDSYYTLIPGHSRTLPGGITLFPPTAPSESQPSGPWLSYNLYLFTAPPYGANVTLYLSTALNASPGRPLKYAIQLGSSAPVQEVQFVPDTTGTGVLPDGWLQAVADSVWKSQTNWSSTVVIGEVELKIWLLEPGFALQKIVVDLGGVQPSYLGPPESVVV